MEYYFNHMNAKLGRFLPKSDKFKRKCRTNAEHGIAILFFDKKSCYFEYLNSELKFANGFSFR